MIEVEMSCVIAAIVIFAIVCIWLWVISRRYEDVCHKLDNKVVECIKLKDKLDEQPLGIEPVVFEGVKKENKYLQEQNEELANYIKAIISTYTMKGDILINSSDIEKVKYAQLYKDKEVLCNGYYLRVILPENFIESRKETR